MYTNALRDPESLAAVVGEGQDWLECEPIIYVASQVHEERTGDWNLAFNHAAESDYSEPDGTQWEDDDLPRLYPALWALRGW